MKIDKVLDFWDSRPCNIKHSTKEIGTIEYFEEVEKRKFLVEPHIPKFANYEKWAGKKVLEIGCGLGTDSINFVKAGAKLTVIELSEKSLNLCKKRLQNLNYQATFICGNAEKLSELLPNEKFDLIYSFGVIHHSPNPKNIINEVEKFMNKDTELYIMLYSKWCWKGLWIVMAYGKMKFWKWKELIQYYSEAKEGCPVTFVYSKKEIKNLLENFEIISVKKDHIFPYKISEYIKYNYTYNWYWRIMPKFLFRLFEKFFGWHTLIKAKLK